MKLNLTKVKKFAEDMMLDTITVTRDPEGAADDALDLDTGELAPDVGDPATVWTGPALIWCKGGTVERNAAEAGGQQYVHTPYGVIVPLEAPAFKAFDIITVDDSANADLIGRSINVMDSMHHTHTVVTELLCEERIPQLYTR